MRVLLGGEAIDGIDATSVASIPRGWPAGPRTADEDPATHPDVPKLRDLLQQTMTGGAGVVRSSQSLAAAAAAVDELAEALGDRTASVGAGELGNLVQLADALLASARARTESRGAHSRLEFPDTDPAWRRRLVHGGSSR